MPFSSDVLDPADRRSEIRAELCAWLALQWELALQPVAAAQLLHTHRSPRAALAACELPRRSPPPDLKASLAILERIGARAVPCLSPAYPPQLSRLPDPAPLLLVRGDVGVLRETAVAIVGSRAATVAGLDTARSLARDLARAGAVIVSGLAVGIDAAAHRGALEVGGRTVAVLACGPDRMYPARHQQLAADIARNGAVVSELPPGTRPLPPFFPLRNRLISGLASALVVVEARERSGSLVTAGHAANQGVDVFAVPGPLASPTSVGTNRLLRDGAFVVLEAGDVLSELDLPVPPAGAPAAGEARGNRGAELTPDGRALLAAVLREPASREELARRLRRPPEALAAAFLELELAGLAAAGRDGRWRPRPASSSRH